MNTLLKRFRLFVVGPMGLMVVSLWAQAPTTQVRGTAGGDAAERGGLGRGEARGAGGTGAAGAAATEPDFSPRPPAVALPSAKVLFNSPPGSTGNPRGPVGIRYWFTNDAGVRFTDASDAGAGTRLHLHVESNTGGWLTVWTIDQDGKGAQLTPMPGRYAGILLDGSQNYVVPNPITVPRTGASMRLLILFARSQTEQVGTSADAREKIQRLSAGTALDGHPLIVRETDSTLGVASTYIVHRAGAQPGVEVEINQNRGQ